MINIIQRGGIHKTKHEFGPFNRKYTPKRNKKRALIVQRGVYSEHSFAGLNSPSRGRHVKNTARHPFLARLGLKRVAWRLRSLGRLIGEQVTEMSERKGFVRRLLEAQPEAESEQKQSPYEGFNRYRTVKVESDRVLQPGEMIVRLPDGTFEPFLGRGATPHYGEPYEEDYVDTLSIAFGLPKDFIDPRMPKYPSMGFVPKDKLTVSDIEYGIGDPYPRFKEFEVPPATPVPGRTIEHLAPGLDLITDTLHRPREGELLDPVKGWKIVKDIDVRGLFPIKGESVNVTDTQEEVKMTDKKRDILHIILEDGLDLTVDQMTELTQAFNGFIRQPENNVVVTNSGISVKILTVEEGQHIRSTSIVVDNETWNRVWSAEDISDLTVVATHENVTLTPEWPEGSAIPERIDSTAKEPVDDIEATLADLQAEEDQKDRK